MKNRNLKLKISAILFTIYYLLVASLAFAQVPTLSKVRVTYRPDGGVSITAFVAGACQGGETEEQCMDKEMQKNPELANLPHDDVDPATLPQDRKDRDKWTGSKGQGVSIDHSKVTKTEKIEQLENQLDEELDKSSPNSTKVAKIQRTIEKVKKYSAKNNLIPPEKLAELDPNNTNTNQSFLASVTDTISSAVSGISSAFSSILTSIQNGFLALKQLTTNTIQIGSPEQPSGITTYDQTTKQPYCIVVKDGQIQNIPGECGTAQPPAPTPSPAPQPELESTPIDTASTTTPLP